jgi:hypothetical protein
MVSGTTVITVVGKGAYVIRASFLLVLSACQLIFTQSFDRAISAKNPPRFEDYPAEVWNGVPAPVKLATRSERMFVTRLTEAGKGPPDFAGRYKFAGWGCGSVCAAGAIVDLQTGVVFPPPLGSPKKNGWARWIFAGGPVQGSYVEYRQDSGLMIVRNIEGGKPPNGFTYLQQTHYLVWETDHFREILRVSKPI